MNLISVTSTRHPLFVSVRAHRTLVPSHLYSSSPSFTCPPRLPMINWSSGLRTTLAHPSTSSNSPSYEHMLSDRTYLALLPTPRTTHLSHISCGNPHKKHPEYLCSLFFVKSSVRTSRASSSASCASSRHSSAAPCSTRRPPGCSWHPIQCRPFHLRTTYRRRS